MVKYHDFIKVGFINSIPVIFVILWASGSVFVKIGLEYSSVWTFLFLRSFLTGMILYLISIFIYKNNIKKEKNGYSDLKNSLFSGFFLQFLYQTFFFLSINSGLSIGLLAIILGVQPIITPIIAKEKISNKLYLFLFLAFLGLIITIIGYRKIEGFSLIGIIFAFISVFSFSIGTVLQKKNTYSLIDNLKNQFIFSSLLFLCPILLGQWHIDFTYQFSLSLVWMVFIVSIGATFLLLLMIKSTQASRVSSLFFCVPPLTMIFDYLFFSGKITLLSIFGTLITIFSVRIFFILTRDKNTQKKYENSQKIKLR